MLIYVEFVLADAKLHVSALNRLTTNHISLNKYFTKAAKIFRLLQLREVGGSFL
jgi:hypothetical protein